MKDKIKFLITVAATVLFSALTPNVDAQTDIYGGTTTTTLLAVGARDHTNALAFGTIASPTSVDVKDYIGQPSLILTADTNNVGPYTVLVISSNTVYNTLITNTFATINLNTNANQVIPFDTTANGRLVQVQWLCLTANTNRFGVVIVGRKKDQ